MSTDTPPLLENAARDLACFATGLRFGDIPVDSRERVTTGTSAARADISFATLELL